MAQVLGSATQEGDSDGVPGSELLPGPVVATVYLRNKSEGIRNSKSQAVSEKSAGGKQMSLGGRRSLRETT